MLFVAVILIIGAALLAWSTFGYHGVSDSETVEILQTEWASHNHVAQLVRRSDHAALSGDTYFIFVADHLYSVPKLRKELYSLPPVFVADRSGIVLHWLSPHELSIQCQDCGITKGRMETQKFSQEDVVIRYVGFPSE